MGLGVMKLVCVGIRDRTNTSRTEDGQMHDWERTIRVVFPTIRHMGVTCACLIKPVCLITCMCLPAPHTFMYLQTCGNGRILPRHRLPAFPPQRKLRIGRQRPGRIHTRRNLFVCLNTSFIIIGCAVKPCVIGLAPGNTTPGRDCEARSLSGDIMGIGMNSGWITTSTQGSAALFVGMRVTCMTWCRELRYL